MCDSRMKELDDNLDGSVFWTGGFAKHSATRRGGKLFGEFVTDNAPVASYLWRWTKPTSRIPSVGMDAKAPGLRHDLPARHSFLQVVPTGNGGRRFLLASGG